MAESRGGRAEDGEGVEALLQCGVEHVLGAVLGGGSLVLLTGKKTGGSQMGWGWGEAGG